ncbi:MAG: NF038143 family protein [Desulfobacteraceae bacterium]|nr:NF038143 family protein [Desulfobacteraceae bacterium]
MNTNNRQKASPDPYKIILREEERFAREAALSLLVTRPPPLWRTIIPGMFLLDFLERKKIIRLLRSSYMPPRTVALRAARSSNPKPANEILSEQNRESAPKDLKYLCSFHGRPGHILAELVDALTNQYAALVAEGGATFAELVKNAYNSPKDLWAVEDRICGLEYDWNEAVKADGGKAPFPEGHYQEFVSRRKKRAEQIF